MTPKEKANKLTNAFVFKSVFEMTNDELKIARIYAKQCALIAVDEVINQYYTHTDNVTQHEYWQQVKQEIEKL